MNLKRRLRVLERFVVTSDELRVLERFVVTSDDNRCGVCGHVPGSRPKLEVTFDHVDGPDACPECGRPLVLRLSFNGPQDVGALSSAPWKRREGGCASGSAR